MRIYNLESLRHHGADLGTAVLPYLESTTSAVTALVVRRTILKGRLDQVSNFLDFCKVLGVSLKGIYRELSLYSQHNLSTEPLLLEDDAILQTLRVKL